MEYKTLLKANIKQYKGSLLGVFILLWLACAALGTVLCIWINSELYIRGELKRAGFGTLTAWIVDVPDKGAFTNEHLGESVITIADDIESLEAVSQVDIQPVLYSNYMANGQRSDSQGQLIPYAQNDNRYKFFADDLSQYCKEVPRIFPGEIYVSPSMISMFGIEIGDQISFPVVRGQKEAVFTVKGFYEDPFMGSSMIGMKGFLVNESDYIKILHTLQGSGIDALARNGAMLHIFPTDTGTASTAWLNSMINKSTRLPEYTEFLHSDSTIADFMLILQNAFSGLLSAFVVVLLLVVIIVLSHSIGSAIEDDYVTMGILKTLGFTGRKLRNIQMLPYLFAILCSMCAGILVTIPLSRFVSHATLTITGIRIPTKLPIFWCLLSYGLVFLMLFSFLFIKAGRIYKITPMEAIRGQAFKTTNSKEKRVPIYRSHLTICLASRQLLAEARRYMGAFIVAVLLVFFASFLGRMDSWLGADGQGMMNAFNPADHDIGIQIYGKHTIQEVENTMKSYTYISSPYLLAMPGVSVNGIDYTANVISEPERFHIIEGKTSFSDHEIVLTEFVASNLGVSIGDTVLVQADMGSQEYVVSGIYTCANDMGNNVGMSRQAYLRIGQDNPGIWCYHYFLEDTSKKTAVLEVLKTAYGGDIHVHENTWPGLYGIIAVMQALMVLLYVMVTVFILVVTALTSSKILKAEQRDMGIYKSIGFLGYQLRSAFALRFLLIAFLGSVVGIILSSALTDPLVSIFMRMAGISNFSSSMTVRNTLMPCLVVMILFLCFSYAVSSRIKRVDLTVLIIE